MPPVVRRLCLLHLRACTCFLSKSSPARAVPLLLLSPLLLVWLLLLLLLLVWLLLVRLVKHHQRLGTFPLHPGLEQFTRIGG